LLDVLSIQRIARSDIKAWASAAASINRLLDVCAASEVLYLMRVLEGHSNPDRGQMLAGGRSSVCSKHSRQRR
jgi:hypothetical protein